MNFMCSIPNCITCMLIYNMVHYIYSLKLRTDDVEFLICLNEKQNKFFEKKLVNKQAVKLVIFTGFNCDVSWSFPDTLDVINRCVCHENIDLRNIINNMYPAKTAIKSIDVAIEQNIIPW